MTTAILKQARFSYREVGIFASFLAVSAILPALIHSQPITGTIVNALLFLSTVLLGPVAGILVGFTSSPIALSMGLLPAPFAPMIPFIIGGNAVLVGVFFTVYQTKKNFLLAAAIAAFAKFAVLFLVVATFAGSFVSPTLLPTLSTMMGLPQLMTALAGGLLAHIILQRMGKI